MEQEENKKSKHKIYNPTFLRNINRGCNLFLLFIVLDMATSPGKIA
jgi:hypothetical protein